MLDEGDLGEPDLDGMAGSYRAQTGHLTRRIKRAAVLVKEAALRAPSTIFLDQLKRALAEVRDQQEKCAAICEDIRDAQDQTDDNEAHIEGCLDRDADQADQVAVLVTREMARCEIGLRPPVVGAPGPNVGQVRVICVCVCV
jgi:ABC-type transporter Mla subunit MlaD